MGAKNGILFKTAVSLEEAGKIQIVALDKTGTITKGEPQVTDMVPAKGISEEELLGYAYALEKKSEHPLAKAIIARAEEKKIVLQKVSDFQALPGNGLRAALNSDVLTGGNMKFISNETSVSPELMKQAEKFGRPVVTFVDTPGAACGIEAEERGQGEAIARNLLEMSGIQTPMVSILIGEGGSGGALGLAVTDEVWMMENATYSILSPEGFASILWKDGKRAKEASEVMKITAKDLKKLQIIEKVIREPEPANEENLPEIAEEIREDLDGFLRKSCQKTREQIVEERYERFRRM